MQFEEHMPVRVEEIGLAHSLLKNCINDMMSLCSFVGSISRTRGLRARDVPQVASEERNRRMRLLKRFLPTYTCTQPSAKKAEVPCGL